MGLHPLLLFVSLGCLPCGTGFLNQGCSGRGKWNGVLLVIAASTLGRGPLALDLGCEETKKGASWDAAGALFEVSRTLPLRCDPAAGYESRRVEP